MLKEKYLAIIEFIKNYPHDYSPTVREIGAAVGLRSSATVHYYLTVLEREGYIERRPNCRRCILLKVSGVK